MFDIFKMLLEFGEQVLNTVDISQWPYILQIERSFISFLITLRKIFGKKTEYPEKREYIRERSS
jgi:hypothetical protein